VIVLKDYKDTLHMPKTGFPMRGKLGKNEPLRQAFWNELDIYDKRLEKNKDNTPFVMPDGPPYANGNIHIGTAMNKILKDMIVRSRSMQGFYTRYLPGWDTHGLPIETSLTKNEGVDRKALSTVEFRKLCADYAYRQVDIQKAQFKRLGILGEWDTPYLTLKPHYEGSQMEIFADFVEKGLIFRGLKPIFWSPSSETALAEAEIEYRDKKSPSIYFTFDAVDTKNFEGPFKFLVWTTTPWTLPANLATAVADAIDYVFVDTGKGVYVMGEALLSQISEKLGFEKTDVIRRAKGSELVGMTYKHPLYDRVSPILSGHHVTIESGTGLVHIAPGHGEDDFLIGKANNLEVLCPVDERGHMTKESGKYEGMFVEKASKEVVKDMDALGHLEKLEWIVHSYPHDWRTKKPVIFRATNQWFASIEKIKDDLIREVKNVKWIPSWGETRMENMVKDRETWCISRQRIWGVPIPVFYHENGEPILDADIVRHVASLFKEHGSNIWYEWDAKALLPDGYESELSPNGQFKKETDTLDVWFDSGTSHKGGMTDYGMSYPADLYIEGSDQYRGWFNSSLITGVSSFGKAPYKSVLTHGFVMDDKGRKMSKSLGNVVNPNDVANSLGADILRLWVASVDYQADVRISDRMMKQVTETYRKLRNTIRFMLGLLSDFDIEKHGMAFESLESTDQFMLSELDDLKESVSRHYDTYEFDDVTREITRFVTNRVSAFYLDILKDIVYIEAKEDPVRRSAQTAVYKIVEALLPMLTPIMPHTTEEAYQFLPSHKEESVYLENMPRRAYPENKALKERFDALLMIRNDVMKALENARNEKIIGKSLEAKLTLYPKDKATALLLESFKNLEQLFIVSAVNIDIFNKGAHTYERLSVDVALQEGEKCARCWQVTDVNDEGICERCGEVLRKDA